MEKEWIQESYIYSIYEAKLVANKDIHYTTLQELQ